MGTSEIAAIVDVNNFLVAMRDAGYRDPAAAVAELIDNSIEAGANLIEVRVLDAATPEWPLALEVQDDGAGMSPSELQRSVAFGGSSRFGSRKALGRFGMGLPAASLSLARLVEVESWRSASVHTVRLSLGDVDVPVTRVTTRRRQESSAPTSGTVVRLVDCDRLGYKSAAWLSKMLIDRLSRVFRHHLQGGTRIKVNDVDLSPADHLVVQRGAKPYGDVLAYEVAGTGGTGSIRVRFSELPVQAWSGLSADEKSKRGATTRRPVSITRAGREIDCGWWFMGSKKRENYDSWWRCEIDFSPCLDELFGVTFTKQHVRPTSELRELLSADLEPIARALNARVRSEFEFAKLTDPLMRAQAVANDSLALLPDHLTRREIRLELARLDSRATLQVVATSFLATVRLNSAHPFVRDLYLPLAQDPSPAQHAAATRVALVAVAQALVSSSLPGGSGLVDWGDVAATFLERCP